MNAATTYVVNVIHVEMQQKYEMRGDALFALFRTKRTDQNDKISYTEWEDGAFSINNFETVMQNKQKTFFSNIYKYFAKLF